MRDYGKGGALTEVTFYILLALYTPGMAMPSCNSLKRRPAGGSCWGRALYTAR